MLRLSLVCLNESNLHRARPTRTRASQRSHATRMTAHVTPLGSELIQPSSGKWDLHWHVPGSRPAHPTLKQCWSRDSSWPTLPNRSHKDLKNAILYFYWHLVNVLYLWCIVPCTSTLRSAECTVAPGCATDYTAVACPGTPIDCTKAAHTVNSIWPLDTWYPLGSDADDLCATVV